MTQREKGLVLFRRAGLLICAATIASILGSCASLDAQRERPELVSREDAIDIAKHLAPQYGYPLDYMDLEVLKNITPWDKRFPGLKFFEQPRYADIKKKLADRRYWAINYLPDFPRYGGSFCVFIDADTGEVIDIFMGW